MMRGTNNLYSLTFSHQIYFVQHFADYSSDCLLFQCWCVSISYLIWWVSTVVLYSLSALYSIGLHVIHCWQHHIFFVGLNGFMFCASRHYEEIDTLHLSGPNFTVIFFHSVHTWLSCALAVLWGSQMIFSADIDWSTGNVYVSPDGHGKASPHEEPVGFN